MWQGRRLEKDFRERSKDGDTKEDRKLTDRNHTGSMEQLEVGVQVPVESFLD